MDRSREGHPTTGVVHHSDRGVQYLSNSCGALPPSRSLMEIASRAPRACSASGAQSRSLCLLRADAHSVRFDWIPQCSGASDNRFRAGHAVGGAGPVVGSKTGRLVGSKTSVIEFRVAKLWLLPVGAGLPASDDCAYSLSLAVAECGAPTIFDSGDPRWRR